MRRPHDWYSAFVIAVAAAASAVAYPRLPDRVPVHWGISGEPDRLGTRLEGVWLLPAVMLGLWLLMRAFPKLDPRGESYAKMRSTYDFVINATLTVMLALHAVVIAAGLGFVVPMRRFVPLVGGAFFIALGNVLPRTRPNWILGVRTPWTLSNDRVWTRTHRVAGYLMTGAGVVVVVTAAIPGLASAVAAIAALTVAAFGSVIYSYLAWRQETRS
jgi:uncharacterized membrane protein